MSRMRLTLLTRDGCHLCEEYAQALLAHFAERVELHHAEVSERIDWLREFGSRIPVLLDERGRVLGEAHFDAEAVERALRRG